MPYTAKLRSEHYRGGMKAIWYSKEKETLAEFKKRMEAGGSNPSYYEISQGKAV